MKFKTIYIFLGRGKLFYNVIIMSVMSNGLCVWSLTSSEGVPEKKSQVASDKLLDSPSKLPCIHL